MSDTFSPKLKRQYATPSATAGNNPAGSSEPGAQQQEQQHEQEVIGEAHHPRQVHQPGQATVLRQEDAQQPTQQQDARAAQPAAKRQKLSYALWSDKSYDKPSKINTSSCHGCSNNVYKGAHGGKQGAGRPTLLRCTA
jgi:hypothetical protein